MTNIEKEIINKLLNNFNGYNFDDNNFDEDFFKKINSNEVKTDILFKGKLILSGSNTNLSEDIETNAYNKNYFEHNNNNNLLLSKKIIEELRLDGDTKNNITKNITKGIKLLYNSYKNISTDDNFKLSFECPICKSTEIDLLPYLATFKYNEESSSKEKLEEINKLAHIITDKIVLEIVKRAYVTTFKETIQMLSNNDKVNNFSMYNDNKMTNILDNLIKMPTMIEEKIEKSMRSPLLIKDVLLEVDYHSNINLEYAYSRLGKNENLKNILKEVIYIQKQQFNNSINNNSKNNFIKN